MYISCTRTRIIKKHCCFI